MPRTVRITVGFSGVGSILRRIRVIRRSMARSNGSRLRWLVVSSSQSRDSGRSGFSAKGFQDAELAPGHRHVVADLVDGTAGERAGELGFLPERVYISGQRARSAQGRVHRVSR